MDTERRLKLREFCRQVAALTDEQRVALAARMPIVTCEGHPLSTFNQCMLALQAQRVLTVIGGFRQWKKAGRYVRQGEHSCGCIWVPMGKRNGSGDTEETEGETGNGPSDTDEVTDFILVSVFDITQTEAIQVEVAA